MCVNGVRESCTICLGPLALNGCTVVLESRRVNIASTRRVATVRFMEWLRRVREVIVRSSARIALRKYSTPRHLLELEDRKRGFLPQYLHLDRSCWTIRLLAERLLHAIYETSHGIHRLVQPNYCRSLILQCHLCNELILYCYLRNERNCLSYATYSIAL
jgi:hypothetical protein